MSLGGIDHADEPLQLVKPSAESDLARALMPIVDNDSLRIHPPSASKPEAAVNSSAEDASESSAAAAASVLGSKFTSHDHLHRVLQRVQKQNAFMTAVAQASEEQQLLHDQEEELLVAEANRIRGLRAQKKNERELLEKVTQWSLWIRTDQMEHLPAQASMSWNESASDILQMGRGRLLVVLKALCSKQPLQKSRALLCLSSTLIWSQAVQRDSESSSSRSDEKKYPVESPRNSASDGYSYLLLIRDFAVSLFAPLSRCSDDLVVHNIALALQLLVSNPRNLPILLLHLPALENLAFFIALHAKSSLVRLHALTAAHHLTTFTLMNYLQPHSSSTLLPPRLASILRGIDSPLFQSHDTIVDPADTEAMTEVEAAELEIPQQMEQQLEELVSQITERVVSGAEVAAAVFDSDISPSNLPVVPEEDAASSSSSTNTSTTAPVQLLPAAAVQLLLELILGPDQSLQARTRHVGVIDEILPLNPHQTLLFEAETLLQTRLTQLYTLEKLTALQQKGKLPFPHPDRTTVHLTAPLRCAITAMQVLANLAALPQHQPVLMACKQLLPTIVALAQWPLIQSASNQSLSNDPDVESVSPTITTSANNSATSAVLATRPYSYVGRLLLQCISNFSLNPSTHSILLQTDSCSAVMMQYLNAGPSFFTLSPFVYAQYERKQEAENDLDSNPYVLTTSSALQRSKAFPFHIPASHHISNHSQQQQQQSLIFGLDPDPDPRVFSIMSASYLSNICGMAGQYPLDELVRLLKPEKGLLPSQQAAKLQLILSGQVRRSLSFDSAWKDELEILLECLAEGCTRVDEASARLLLMSLVRVTGRERFQLHREPSTLLIDALLNSIKMRESLDVKHFALVVLSNLLTHLPDHIEDTSPFHACVPKLMSMYFEMLERHDPGVTILSLASIDRLLRLPSGNGVLLRMEHGGAEAITTLAQQASYPDLSLQLTTLCVLATFMLSAKNEGGLLGELLQQVQPSLLTLLLRLSLSPSDILHLHASRLLLSVFDNKIPDVHGLLALGDGSLQLLFRLISSNTDLPLKLRALTLTRSISAHAVYQPSLVRIGIPGYCCKWVLDAPSAHLWEHNQAGFNQLRSEACSKQLESQVQAERYDRVLLLPVLAQLRQKMFDEWCGDHARSLVVHPLLEIALMCKNICTTVAPALAITVAEPTSAQPEAASPDKAAGKGKNGKAVSTSSSSSKKKPKLQRGKSAVASPKSATNKRAVAAAAAASQISNEVPDKSTAKRPSPLALEIFRLLLDARVLDLCMRLGREPHAVETNRMALMALQAMLPFASEQLRQAQHHLPTRRTLLQCCSLLLSTSTSAVSVTTPAEAVSILRIVLDLIINEQAVASWVQTDGVGVTLSLWRPSVPVAKGDGVQYGLNRILLRLLQESNSNLRLPLDALQLNLLLSLVALEPPPPPAPVPTAARHLGRQTPAPPAPKLSPAEKQLQHSSMQLLAALSADDSFRLPLVKLGGLTVFAKLQQRKDMFLRDGSAESLCNLLHNDAILLVENKQVDLLELLIPMSRSDNMRVKNLAANCLVRLAMYKDEHKLAQIKRGLIPSVEASLTPSTTSSSLITNHSNYRATSASKVPPPQRGSVATLRPPSSTKKTTPHVLLTPVGMTSPLQQNQPPSSNGVGTLENRGQHTPQLGPQLDTSHLQPTPTAIAPSVHRALDFTAASPYTSKDADEEAKYASGSSVPPTVKRGQLAEVTGILSPPANGATSYAVLLSQPHVSSPNDSEPADDEYANDDFDAF